jgi:hypothetical protein
MPTFFLVGRLGVLVVGVVGVCCLPKGLCGVVAIRWRSLESLIQ